MPSHHQNDLPTTLDKLGWDKELTRIVARILACTPPHALGVHGDWGSGKTSFMRQIQLQLGGDAYEDGNVSAERGAPLDPTARTAVQNQCVTIWFDAWRYQNEPVPIVALLHEMRRQMAVLPILKEKFEKLGNVAFYTLLDNLSALGKVIGFEGMPGVDKIERRGEAWEKNHHQEILATNSLSQHLRQTIAALLPDNNARVVIFIDDIDRCNPKAAMRLLEGLKIYMTIPNCVFVLGMNERILIDAIREEFSANKDATQDDWKLRASHYLEKICTDIYRLPSPHKPAELLGAWLHDTDQKQALLLAIGDVHCLPPNPRRLKALANQWSRFAGYIPFPPVAEAEEQKHWAVRLLVAASIHQFHREIWERWHFHADFWNEIQAWCNLPLAEADKAKWAGTLQLTYAPDVSDPSSDKSQHVNPCDINIFWIGALIRMYSDHLKPQDFDSLLKMQGVTS